MSPILPRLTLAHILLLLLSFLFLAIFAIAQTHPVTVTPSPSVPPSPLPDSVSWANGKIFSISTKQPMRQLLQRDSDYLQGQLIAQRYVEDMEAAVIASIKNGKPPSVSPSTATSLIGSPPSKTRTNNHSRPHLQPRRKSHPEVMSCNHSGRFQNAVRNHMILRGLPPADVSCMSDHTGPLTRTTTAKHIFHGLQQRGGATARNQLRIADVTVGNWTSETSTEYAFAHEEEGIGCTVLYAGGVRVSSKWYLITEVTNLPGEMHRPQWGRQVLAEYHHLLPNGSLGDALRMSVPVRDPESPERVREDRATTLLISRGGGSGPSYFGALYMAEIPAVIDATDKLSLKIQQANDALTPSNLAILTLPLFLALVPSYALTASSNTALLAAYVAATDVVSVVPLLAKGVELVHIGRFRAYSSSVRITSPSNGTLGSSAGAHLWATRCHVQRNVSAIGWTFITIAIAFMAAGIASEFAARAYIMKKMRLVNTPVGWDNQQFESLDERNWIDTTRKPAIQSSAIDDFGSSDEDFLGTLAKFPFVPQRKRKRYQKASYDSF